MLLAHSTPTTVRGSSYGTMACRAMPLLTSLAFHGGLLGAGFLTYQSVRALVRHQTQVTVPETPLLVEEVIDHVADNIPNDRRNPASAGIHAPTESHPSWNPESPVRTSSSLRSIQSQNPVSDSIIGPGPVGRTLRSPAGGEPYGAAGSFAFGPGSSSSGTPNIFGPAAVRSARSVAFLCDASGSMLGKIAALKGEIDKAIMSLRPVQSFDIIFFGDNRSDSLSPHMLMATPDNKVRATEFLETVTPRGPTDPLPALELAFAEKPQLIFLLTDGDFPDNDAVLKRIQELNGQKIVKISTIAFVGEGDTDTAFISLLKQIAAENGGIYKHVAQDHLP